MANYTTFYHIKKTEEERIQSFVVIHQGKQYTIYKNLVKFLNKKKNVLRSGKNKLNTSKLIDDFFEKDKYLIDANVEELFLDVNYEKWEDFKKKIKTFKNRKELLNYNENFYNEHMWNNYLVLIDEDSYSILDIWSKNISEDSKIINQEYNWDEDLKIKIKDDE